VRPLRHAIALAGRIAGGDLTAEITSSAATRRRTVASAEDMNDSLQKIVARCAQHRFDRDRSKQIARQRGSVAAPEEQASSLEETASSMKNSPAR